MATALVTGASGGIGLELSRVHAATGGDLVLVARSAERLDSIARDLEQAYSVRVATIPMDLSDPGAVERVRNAVRGREITIDYLVNNAGVGRHGDFAEYPWDVDMNMLSLNVVALTGLSKLFAQEMVARGSGRIMNVASTASFQPGPHMAVYCATKAYVLSFSEAIAHEFRGAGVTVTALCPGPTASGFQTAAAMETSALVKGRRLPTSREVAEYGYKAMLRGQSVAVHGVANRVMASAVRFTPRRLATAIAGAILR